MPKKIEKYAQDSVVFYLHKQRNFISKIERQVAEERKIRDDRERGQQMVEKTQK